MQSARNLRSSVRKRKIAVESKASNGQENRTADVPSLEILYRTTWYTYKASPLYKFNATRNGLLNYSRHLSAMVHAHLAKNVGVIVGNSTNDSIKASFVVIDEFVQRYTDTGILITVAAKGKIIYRGILCSVGTPTSSEFIREQASFATLPLFLNNGNKTIRNIVLEYLKTNFNCFVSPLTFPTAELSWMATIWACSEENNLPLHLCYILPLKELTTVKYEISRDSIEPIWKYVKGSSDHLTEDKVNKFMELLEKHFNYICRISLFTFQLAEIGTSAAVVHKDGKIKILSQSAIYKVLSHLNNLCEEIIFAQQDEKIDLSNANKINGL